MRSSSSCRGGALLAGLLFPLGLVLLVGGAERLWMAHENPAVSTFTAQEYLVRRPAAAWLELTEAQLDLTEPVYKPDSAGNVREVYIPVKVPGEEMAETTLLFYTRDPKILSPLQDLSRLTDAAARQRWVQEHAAELQPVRDLKGALRPWVDYRVGDRLSLMRLDEQLSRTHGILDEGTAPNRNEGILYAGGGAVLLLMALGQWRSSKSRLVMPERRPASKPAGGTEPTDAAERAAIEAADDFGLGAEAGESSTGNGKHAGREGDDSAASR